MLRQALRTQGMRKMRLGVLLNVFLDSLPTVGVGADFVAVHANGDDALQHLDVVEPGRVRMRSLTTQK